MDMALRFAPSWSWTGGKNTQIRASLMTLLLSEALVMVLFTRRTLAALDVARTSPVTNSQMMVFEAECF